MRKRIPIWVGGNSARAIRRAAELGDGWHPALSAPEELEQGLRLLRAECARGGRPFEQLTLSLRAMFSVKRAKSPQRSPLHGTAEEVVEDLQRYKALGIRVVVLEAPFEDLEELVQAYETFANEVRPHVRN